VYWRTAPLLKGAPHLLRLAVAEVVVEEVVVKVAMVSHSAKTE
jgi:hypothetical protein